MTTITLGNNSYTLVPTPSSPGFAEVTPGMTDSVAVVSSPYVPSQVQAQAWPGSDGWTMTCLLPKMLPWQTGAWVGFLGALRGRLNVFQVGDQSRPNPLGVVRIASKLVVDSSLPANNQVATNVLSTRGWTPNVFRQLLPGDYLQVGYRLHVVTAQVNSDSNGDAQISVWPSLRETPADATAIVLSNPVGLFRLVANHREWHTTVDRISQLSLQAMEAR